MVNSDSVVNSSTVTVLLILTVLCKFQYCDSVVNSESAVNSSTVTVLLILTVLYILVL